jgi:hypothetical protein
MFPSWWFLYGSIQKNKVGACKAFSGRWPSPSGSVSPSAAAGFDPDFDTDAGPDHDHWHSGGQTTAQVVATPYIWQIDPFLYASPLR